MLIPVTSPIAWMGLAAVAVMIFAVVLWSIFGAFTVKAEGMGLIMDSAGVVNISHAASGKITRVYVHNGSYVHSGDLIAHMEQPEQVADTRRNINKRRAKISTVSMTELLIRFLSKREV